MRAICYCPKTDRCRDARGRFVKAGPAVKAALIAKAAGVVVISAWTLHELVGEDLVAGLRQDGKVVAFKPNGERVKTTGKKLAAALIGTALRKVA